MLKYHAPYNVSHHDRYFNLFRSLEELEAVSVVAFCLPHLSIFCPHMFRPLDSEIPSS
jgi:hypothetical protein